MKFFKNNLSAIILTVTVYMGLSAVPVFAKSESLALLTAFNSVTLSNITVETTLATVKDNAISSIDADKADKIQRLDAYFEKRDMPLAGYGAKFVEVAEKCDIDWRLLPAIGVRESSGGKHLMNNNPFGWGSAKIKFDDFNEAIEVVSDNLCGLNDATAKYYKDQTTYKRLWYYNGTVLHSYPDEVIDIMDMM